MAHATDTETAPEPDAHDHDHDHDEHDHEHDEVDEAQAEADVARMGDALAAIDDDVLRDALAEMSEKSRLEVASQIQLPRATMHLGQGLVPVFRRKLRGAGADHQLQVLFALAEHVNDDTIKALGDSAEDPSADELRAVLPGILENHPASLVSAMVAGYAASDAPCRSAMREVLDSEEALAIGPPAFVEERPSSLFAPPKVVDKKELAAKREARRAAKDAKRAAELRDKEMKQSAEAKRRAALHKSKRKSR